MKETTANNLKLDPRIRDAAQIAVKKARLYSTKMAILKDGKVVEVTPDEFERGLAK